MIAVELARTRMRRLRLFPLWMVWNILTKPLSCQRSVGVTWEGVFMAKLSELFGRREEAGPYKAVPPIGGKPDEGNGGGRQPATGGAIDTFSDVGSRIGEENEELRNLLSDTGRQIDELEKLKLAFDKLVTPFNSTLRALEQEKSKTLSLAGMLEESRAGSERLRSEFYEIEKRATAA
jgi:crescentin